LFLSIDKKHPLRITADGETYSIFGGGDAMAAARALNWV
jgi:hypothetical protein